ncbi:MAG: hypothetical protein AAGA76_10415, partial [Pseudomonadota bacterium]
QKKPEYNRNFVLTAIGALMLSSVMGSFWGGSIRGIKEDDSNRYKEWLLQYEKIELPVKLKQLEKQLDN